MYTVNSHPRTCAFRTQQTLDQRNLLIDDMKKELDHHHQQEDIILQLVLCNIISNLYLVC